MDVASKINNQLMKMIVMFFSNDTRCFVKTLNLNYFQNNEKQSSEYELCKIY